MGISGPNLTVMERQKDIDGLVAALHHGNSKIRERAASALDRMKWEPGNEDEKALYLGGKRAWEELAGMGEIGLKPLAIALSHKDLRMRRLIKGFLDKSIATHQERAVEPLSWVLQASFRGFDRLATEARSKVAEILSKIGDPRAAVPLVRSYEDLTHTYLEIPINQRKACERVWLKYRETVVRILNEIGKPAVDAMVQELKDKTNSVSAGSILSMLGNMGEPAVEALIEALKHPDKTIRRHAAGALRMNPDTRAVEPLVAALEDDDVKVRDSAVQTLAAWRVPAAGLALAQRLRDKDSHVREKAVRALQDLMKVEAWHPADTAEMAYLLLAGLLASGSRPKVIFDQIAKLGLLAVEPLIQSLNIEGVIFIQQWGRQSADIKYPASDAAIWLLKEIGQPAVEPLIEALKHKDKAIRRNAARTLGEIRDSRAKEALTKALVDKDEDVQKAAKKALKRLK